MKKFIYLGLALLVLLMGCVDDKPRADNVVAVFDGGVLTREDLDAHYHSLGKQHKYKETPELLTPEFVFDHALNMEMIIAEGLKRELHHDAYIRQDLHNQMSNLFLKIMQDDLVPGIDRESITEEEMRCFYEEHKESYCDKVRYSLLAFEVDPEQAAEVMGKLTAGELDFKEATRLYALNDEERGNGGYTGTRTLRRFKPAWQPVVEALETGKITGPLAINGKSYIMLLKNRTKPYQHSYEGKEAYIRNDVLYNKYRDAWQEVYNRLKEEFKVKIDKERLAAFYHQMAENKGKGD